MTAISDPKAALLPTKTVVFRHPEAEKQLKSQAAFFRFKTHRVDFSVRVYDPKTSQRTYELLKGKKVSLFRPEDAEGQYHTFLSELLSYFDPNIAISAPTVSAGELKSFTWSLNTTQDKEQLHDIITTALQYLNWHPDFRRASHLKSSLKEKPDAFQLMLTQRHVPPKSEYYKTHVGIPISEEDMQLRLDENQALFCQPLPNQEEISPLLVAEFLTPIILLFDPTADIAPLILDGPVSNCAAIHTQIACLTFIDLLTSVSNLGPHTFSSSLHPEPTKGYTYLVTVSSKQFRRRQSPFKRIQLFQDQIHGHVSRNRASPNLLAKLSDAFQSFSPETTLEETNSATTRPSHLLIHTPLERYAVIKTLEACLRAASLSDKKFEDTRFSVTMQKEGPQKTYGVEFSPSEARNRVNFDREDRGFVVVDPKTYSSWRPRSPDYGLIEAVHEEMDPVTEALRAAKDTLTYFQSFLV